MIVILERAGHVRARAFELLMPKSLLRIVSFLLIPCMAADPAFAAVYSIARLAKPSPLSSFQTQALMPLIRHMARGRWHGAVKQAQADTAVYRSLGASTPPRRRGPLELFRALNRWLVENPKGMRIWGVASLVVKLVPLVFDTPSLFRFPALEHGSHWVWKAFWIAWDIGGLAWWAAVEYQVWRQNRDDRERNALPVWTGGHGSFGASIDSSEEVRKNAAYWDMVVKDIKNRRMYYGIYGSELEALQAAFGEPLWYVDGRRSQPVPNFQVRAEGLYAVRLLRVGGEIHPVVSPGSEVIEGIYRFEISEESFRRMVGHSSLWSTATGQLLEAFLPAALQEQGIDFATLRRAMSLRGLTGIRVEVREHDLPEEVFIENGATDIVIVINKKYLFGQFSVLTRKAAANLVPEIWGNEAIFAGEHGEAATLPLYLSTTIGAIGIRGLRAAIDTFSSVPCPFGILLRDIFETMNDDGVDTLSETQSAFIAQRDWLHHRFSQVEQWVDGMLEGPLNRNNAPWLYRGDRQRIALPVATETNILMHPRLLRGFRHDLAQECTVFVMFVAALAEKVRKNSRNAEQLQLLRALMESMIELKRKSRPSLPRHVLQYLAAFESLFKQVLPYRPLVETVANGSGQAWALAQFDQSLEAIGGLIRFAHLGPEWGDLDLNQLVSKLCRYLDETPQFKNVSVTYSGADRPIRVWGQPVALRRLLMNLIANSLEALQSPRMRRQFKGIAVNIEQTSEDVIVQVRDSGPGVLPRILHKIFEKKVTNKRGSEGLGMGNVEAIVEEHHGTIAIESQEGGTTVTFTMPLDARSRLTARSG